jgi:hypothetical protein
MAGKGGKVSGMLKIFCAAFFTALTFSPALAAAQEVEPDDHERIQTAQILALELECDRGTGDAIGPVHTWVDGKLGPQTERWLKACQQKIGLPANGNLTMELIRSMRDYLGGSSAGYAFRGPWLGVLVASNNKSVSIRGVRTRSRVEASKAAYELCPQGWPSCEVRVVREGFLGAQTCASKWRGGFWTDFQTAATSAEVWEKMSSHEATEEAYCQVLFVASPVDMEDVFVREK